ncbi:MAG TPA: dihydropteroate synthase, partial [Burkholderiales bacterium]|nr:dihydropteroate synthase [Burkholderiales bacterium]
MSFLRCGKFNLSLSRPLIMGIVNVTPDSFSDGGCFFSVDAALAQAERLIGEGADILDVGGESTRPGATPVPLEVELDRVLGVIEALRDCRAPISIDTYKPEVMRAGISAGASMVNDVNALEAPGAPEAVAESEAAVCLMHKQGDPQTMQLDPRYDDVVREVRGYLGERANVCLAAGIARERIVIDPGFGFGKTADHNLALLRELAQLKSLGFPVLAGLSRKSLLGKLTRRPITERVYSS